MAQKGMIRRWWTHRLDGDAVLRHPAEEAAAQRLDAVSQRALPQSTACKAASASV